MWKPLYKQLDIKSPRGRRLKKPTVAALNKFESSTGFKLPDSYREFARVFGPGEIGGYFRIYVPGYKPGADLGRFIATIREAEDVLIESYGDPKFIKRMVPFADTIGGDIIVWDPSAVTDLETHEYRIFMLKNGRPKIVKLADSFPAFIEDVCLSDAFGKLIGDRGYKALKEFTPFGTATPGL